ncbi:hypothetical protein EMEDMD4_20024 [Sinorhizobium medicae]|uniref:Uncharacterized protein n=1 Tax=Sinorhizobium medicae TaxID=110321 RepID=A0A508WTM3_9HYPH|nr:hypothetical protein EMEDMD4_20024 [Sinorhizobium medicae]
MTVWPRTFAALISVLVVSHVSGLNNEHRNDGAGMT